MANESSRESVIINKVRRWYSSLTKSTFKMVFMVQVNIKNGRIGAGTGIRNEGFAVHDSNNEFISVRSPSC